MDASRIIIGTYFLNIKKTIFSHIQNNKSKNKIIEI